MFFAFIKTKEEQMKKTMVSAALTLAAVFGAMVTQADPVWVLCRFDLKPETDKADYIARTQAILETVRAEAGCRDYRLLGDADTTWDKPQKFGERTLWMLECWDSEEALKKHLDTPHMKAFGPSVRPLRDASTFHVLKDVAPVAEAGSWLPVRMNDWSGDDFAARRDLWRADCGGCCASVQLDYAKREVREHAIRKILSAVEKSAADGVELDWTCGKFLRQGRARVDMKIMTDFLRTVRWRLDEVGKAKGRRLKLGVKIPGDAKTAKTLGLDVETWQGEKIVDRVVPCEGCSLKGEPKDVPELMKTFAGEPVTTREQWEQVRKPEIRDFFLREIYGRRPGEKPAKLDFSLAEPDKVMMNGKAIRKRIRVSYGDRCGESSFVFTAFIPATATAAKPAPAFLLICNRDPKVNLDPERQRLSGFWPAEQIVDRGYAAIAFFNGDVAKDYSWNYDDGVYSVFQKPSERNVESWGILSAWSWGASRVMDWIASEALLDARHVAVVGHSRGGKTSLFTGVYDERFAMACVNDSGCGGAKLNHIELPRSEHYDQIWNAIGCWFCGNFERYLYREHQTNFDAHEWIALMAPRLVCIASASEDDWAGQEGEFYAAKFASPAWELYGKKGLVGDAFPGADKPLQEGSVSYHMRTGEHNLTPYDWDRYMDFADRHGWLKK